MKIGEKIRTPRGEFKIIFKSLSEAKAAGFALWFNIYDNERNIIGYAVTGNSETAGWARVGIALA